VHGHRFGLEHQLHRNRLVTQAPDRPDAATWNAWGIDANWSRVLDVPGHDGSTHRWHVLDTGAGVADAATILCVHGNPTWAYAWKSLLTRFGARHRVIAVDQLGMGYSERFDESAGPRRYAQRVADLGDVVDHLAIDRASPLVVAAHDWGGAIALGWAVGHADDVDAMVLCNTGIAVPDGRSAPSIIRLAASAPLRDLVCRRTSTFVEGTVRLSGRQITKLDRVAFRAPYRSAARRRSIADFVGDVPLLDGHPSAGDLDDVASQLGRIEAPVLLAWGARDIVFDDDFALDLQRRLPNAHIERFPEANHLVMAEADVATTIALWLRDLGLDGSDASAVGEKARDDNAADDVHGDSSTAEGESAHHGRGGPGDTPAAAVTESAVEAARLPSTVFDGFERRRGDTSVAIADLAARSHIDFATFGRRVDAVSSDLVAQGLQPGQRVAMLTPPGIDLLVAVYGVWRAGGVTVIADRGLGLRSLGRAVASARPAWSIGPRAAGVASRAMRWAPGSTHLDVASLGSADPDAPAPERWPGPDDEAAILFTSGATGPAKGVRYRHRQLAAQRDALARTYSITDDDRLVAAFAPFALYGPALGVATALTDCDVTTPGQLTAAALDEACEEISATMAFASPAALANVVVTAHGTPTGGLASLRLVFSAGAPVPAEVLHAVRRLAPDASIRTPYGMTEALPVADIDLDAIDQAESGSALRGVCVGSPVDGAEVRVAPLDFDPLAGVPSAMPPNEVGEILVRAPWVSDGYLGLWSTQRRARPGEGWHRSGDVGHVDDDGRLWVEGRMVHVIDTAVGAVTPVPIERAVERALGPDGLVTTGRVAAVGVGPSGTQQIVVVIEVDGAEDGLAGDERSRAVRSVVAESVAAVLVTGRIPVDIRHNAKIDRAAVAEWASALLS
jgi:acyl-CoA synthetase (AMP-forming)/AMP-acid ligase II/pimeloyl-ACP methyl ester carboxylesterase